MKPGVKANVKGEKGGKAKETVKKEEPPKKPWNPTKDESEDDEEDGDDDEEDGDDDDDDESASERGGPPSPVNGNTRRFKRRQSKKFKPRRKGDRIQRTGIVDLNLTDNYGLKSNWGIREGVRELIQNL